MADPKTLKQLFLDDPEMLRAIEAREQASLLRELTTKKTPLQFLEAIKGDKGDKGDTGEKGDMPQRGVDYLTPAEVEEILRFITPIKGIHYFDGKDGKDGISIAGKDGRDGKDGKSISIKEVKKMLATLLEESGYKFSKEDVVSMVSEHIKKETNRLSQALATLRGDMMRNYGGHGGSGASGNYTLMEIPLGTVDGANTIFTVSHTPIYIEVSGQLNVSLTQDPTQYGYTYLNGVINFVVPPTQTPHSFYNP